MGGACGKPPAVWVVAACGGMISLFEKQAGGHLALLPCGGEAVFPSMESFHTILKQAEAEHRLEQLVLVGSANDIAWMHHSLPPTIAHHIAAEINYPLVSGWFREPAPLQGLAGALKQLFSA